jgi:Tropinone reductase 1
MPVTMHNRWSLEGKKAFITGGTKGIGLAIMKECLDLGAEVIFVARTAPDVQKLEKDLIMESNKVKGIAADVSKPSDREMITVEIQKEWDHLDIFVNNAGTNIRKKITEYTDDEVSFLIETNYRSAL